MIGRSLAFRQLLRVIDKLAEYDASVLIEGETGTGKELAARAIHYRSRRRAHPFVPVNCGAIPDTLFESELFGHRRGAFTDAREDQPGLVALAHLGTLFLDEVDTLSPKGQVSLLRFLQDQQFRPVGGRASQQADVRVIAASNKDLDRLAADGRIRTDLLYRLKLLRLCLPPLRDRQGDAAMLAEHFVRTGSARFGKPPKAIAADTLGWFDRYSWPGNIRELEHLVYHEFLMTDGAEIAIATPGELCESAAAADGPLTYRAAKAHAIETFERQFLAAAMARANGSITTAARLVGTERRHLSRLLKRYRVG